MRPALRDTCWLALLVVSLFPWSVSAEVRGETRHVLVLLSSERPVAPQSGFADALVRELIRASRDPIQFVEISVQPARASAEAPGVSSAQRIRSAFGADSLDLVMTIVHSGAREVWVLVRGTAAEVRLHIVDCGIGFDTARAVPGGVGLVAIRERLKLVNGDSVIVSGPGEGTRVEAWVPLSLP